MIPVLLFLAAAWSEPAIVVHDDEPAVIYRARWTGAHLIVQAKLSQGFHTFTMDNKERVAAKLAGKTALATDLPTSIKVSGALEPAGQWRQSAPKDFSKPELRLFAFGFENEATFAVKAKRTAGSSAQVSIRGQACTDKVCKNINLDLDVPLSEATPEAREIEGLLPVESGSPVSYN